MTRLRPVARALEVALGMLVLQAEGSSDVVLPKLLKRQLFLIKFSVFFFGAESPAKYRHVTSTTPPFKAPPSPAEPHRKWGLLALYIAHNPYLTPLYLPFLDPIGGGYAGFVRRKEGDWTPKAAQLQHFTVDRRQRIRES